MYLKLLLLFIQLTYTYNINSCMNSLERNGSRPNYSMILSPLASLPNQLLTGSTIRPSQSWCIQELQRQQPPPWLAHHNPSPQDPLARNHHPTFLV